MPLHNEMDCDNDHAPDLKVAAGLEITRQQLPAAPPRGFTLTELMVAVAVLVVVIIATSKIFGTASQVAGVGQATASVIQEAAAIEAQLRSDLAHVTDEGFFAIRCVAVRNNVKQSTNPNEPLLNPNLPPTAWIRADQLVFFATSVESTQTFRITNYSSHKGEGTASRIYYGPAFQLLYGKPYVPSNAAGDQGHAFDPPPNVTMVPWQSGTITLFQTLYSTVAAAGSGNIFTTTATGGVISAEQPEARRWLLVRQPVVLMNDDGSNSDSNSKTVYLGDSQTARSIFFNSGTNTTFGQTREIRNGRLDAAASQLSDIRRFITMVGSTYRPWAMLTPLPGGSQRKIISDLAVYYPRAERKAPSMHRVDQALTNNVIGSACSSFIVDWTYRDGVGNLDQNNDGIIDHHGPTILLNQPQPWFGMPDLSNPPATFTLPDPDRRTLPFSVWWEVPPADKSIFADPNIDKEPTDFAGNTPNSTTPVIKYEAFFGYNQDQPYLNTTLVPPAPDAHIGDIRASVGYTPFPSAIRVTMTLHDPGGKLEAGRQFQFVIDLPQRHQ